MTKDTVELRLERCGNGILGQNAAASPYKHGLHPRAKPSSCVYCTFTAYSIASIMVPTSFLNLPPEIRNDIYAHILTSASKRLHSPWDDGPSGTSYLPLFLISRQVYFEGSSLLWKSNTQDITLHFDDGVDLESLMQHDLARWPHFHSARF